MSDRGPRRDARKIHIPAPEAGGSPEPGAGASVFASSAPASPAPAVAPVAPSPLARPPRGVPAAAQPVRPPRRRSLLPRRPRLRRVLLLTSLLLPVLLLLTAVGGYLYASSIYDRVEKIPLADVLSPSGHGTTYLIVGSDSRNLADITDAGLNADAFQTDGGERSDTMLLLRFVDGEARMMSVPRDLYVTIADTGRESKINAAYNGGPSRLVRTIQTELGVPIQHYLEVDFVSFAKLVDSLGGITITFPNPAFDRGSGLDVQKAGPRKLDGPQALAFVRSRHYVEVIDGQDKPDPTADLGRVQRQQQFLRAVFGKLGGSRNPLQLARASSATTGGLRVDDGLSLLDATRLAWRLRSLDPTSVPLPVTPGRNSSGSVLFLVQPGAEAALSQFR